MVHDVHVILVVTSKLASWVLGGRIPMCIAVVVIHRPKAGCRRFGGVFDHCLWQELDQGVWACVLVGVVFFVFWGGEKGGVKFPEGFLRVFFV